MPSETAFRPISTYVVKIASRCNLNCKYCYMYNLADKSYVNQPKVMSKEVVDAVIGRIKEHSMKHGVLHATIVFHGGEPLLAGPDFFRYFVEEARTRLLPEVQPHISMQTNATLITTEWLDLLQELSIDFGISLDGPAEINDENRVDHQGRGSHSRVVDAINLMRQHPGFNGKAGSVLTVMNMKSDPLETYHHLRELGFELVEFLFPDGTYEEPPAYVNIEGNDTPYADWLIPIFDEWFAKADGTHNIRFFVNVMRLIFGGLRSTDGIGGRQSAVIVVETDGGIEPVSALKACGDSFTKLGLNVLTHPIDAAYEIPLMREYLRPAGGLCDQCKQCPIVTVCGGGYLPHRYRASNGFENPSIYCRDLTKIIDHIQQRVLKELPEEVRTQLQLATLAELQSAHLETAPASGESPFAAVH